MTMTQTQKDVLTALAERKAQTWRGSAWRSGHGLSGAALAACERKGWAEGRHISLTERTEWRITDAGMAALAK